jgi:murein DD-endopeptidase MepM/ murein hydrolase activator NlpD
MKRIFRINVLFLIISCSRFLPAQIVPVATSWDFPISHSQADYVSAVTACGSPAVVLAFKCYNSERKKFHLGIDIIATAGTDVHASGDGIVRFADQYGWCLGCWQGDTGHAQNGGWGFLIVIEHQLPSGDTILTIYGHLQQQLQVSVGQIVKKGDIIGKVGHYECWGDHLHFGVYKGQFGGLTSGACSVENDLMKRQPFPGFSPEGYIGSRDAKTNYLEPVNFILQNAAPPSGSALAITDVSPNPFPGSNSPQQFTVKGSGFTSNSTVIFRSGGGQVISNQPITQADSAHMVLFPIFGVMSSSWTAEVQNSGQSSGQFSFQVTAQNPIPTIVSVSPNPVPPSSSPQQFTIKGSGFTPSSTVTFRSFPSVGGGQTYPNQPISSQTSFQLILFPTLGITPAQWSAEVLNGAQASGQLFFMVNAPRLNPTIDINPKVGTLGVTSFIRTGRGFTPNGAVTQNVTFPNSGLNTFHVAADGNGAFSVSFILSSETGNYSAFDVDDATGAKSNTINYSVNSATPTTSNLTTSPSPIVLGSQFNFTIHGTNFDPATAQIFLTGPGCPTNTSCVIPTNVMTSKTNTTISGPATITIPGTFSFFVQDGVGGTPSNSQTLVVGGGSPTSSGMTTSPSSVTLGSQFSFTITGTSFDPATAQVYVTGPNCPANTSCVIPTNVMTSKTSISITGPATIFNNGTFNFVVQNGPGGASSNPQALTVTAIPTANGLGSSPSPIVLGSQFNFTIHGTNFDPATAQVFLTGPGCPTNTSCVIPTNVMTSKTNTTISGPATITILGTFSFFVQNGPGGTPSNSQTLIAH